DLTGQKFGRLTVVKRVLPNTTCGNSRWLCQCDCGNQKIICGASLRNNNTKSCGCLHRELVLQRTIKKNTTHGCASRHQQSKEYQTWISMIQRCTNINNPRYQNYGDRGIQVCARWRNSFENFLADMGPKPSDKHSIDRINNDDDYEPSNCRWATRQEQANNKRNNHIIGNKTLAQICRENGLKYQAIWDRIQRYGWSVGRALTTPIREKKKK
ncbi:MAG: hypothetical protein ACW99Q_28300, partial [Candidatus Kariarchaeaceae archaeon]